MLSRQINFYHTKDDLNKFLDYFSKNNFILINKIVKDLENKNESLFKYLNWEIIFEEFQNNFNYEFIKEQNYYYFNIDESYAIEFNLSQDNGEIILPCRFYFTPKYYENETFIDKDKDFVDKAMKFYRQFKKEFLVKNNQVYGRYVTKEIDILVNSGKLAAKPNELVWVR